MSNDYMKDNSIVIDRRDDDPAWTLILPESYYRGNANTMPNDIRSIRYMAARCTGNSDRPTMTGKDWDEFCRVYARNQWDTGVFHDDIQGVKTGESFIDEALKERYCSLDLENSPLEVEGIPFSNTCIVAEEALDPQVPYSPTVTLPNVGCAMKCNKTGYETKFDDELLSLAFVQEAKKPGIHSRVLSNICGYAQDAERKGICSQEVSSDLPRCIQNRNLAKFCGMNEHESRRQDIQEIREKEEEIEEVVEENKTNKVVIYGLGFSLAVVAGFLMYKFLRKEKM